MLEKRIIPCLLLKEGLFVKTQGFNNAKHISEPIYAIKIFNDYEVDELIIVNIMASRIEDTNCAKKKIPLELISKISDESCMPITYGGGISTLEEINNLFRAGIEKVVLNTHAVTNPEIIKLASNEFGRQSIVVSVDVRKENNNYFVYTNCGFRKTELDPISCAQQMEELGAGELLVHSIDRDGFMQGYDIPLVKNVSSASNIPIIALGGAGTYGDLSNVLHKGGASAAAAGSMFVYFGKKKAVLINYPEREEIKNIIKGSVET